MPARKQVILDDIAIDPTKPTPVPMERLFAWVVWQFPRMAEDGYNSAVHPPEAGHGWYPAIVNTDKRLVLIFGHVKGPFTSPEAAAKHLERTAS